MIPLLYKVLGEDGAAIHGGSGKWPLPHDGEPGEWLEVSGDIRCCTNGLHLVANPMPWLQKGAHLFLAEPDLKMPMDFRSDKGAFTRARLIGEVTPDWPLLSMLPAISVFLLSSGVWPEYHPNLRYADLRYADLRYADLRSADLRSANLRSADLRSANLRYADLRYANLSSADLRSANLRYANLSSANLSSANLSSAFRPYNPPDGWKVSYGGLLIRDVPQ
jgi:hypothetical protein